MHGHGKTAAACLAFTINISAAPPASISFAMISGKGIAPASVAAAFTLLGTNSAEASRPEIARLAMMVKTKMLASGLALELRALRQEGVDFFVVTSSVYDRLDVPGVFGREGQNERIREPGTAGVRHPTSAVAISDRE